MCCSRLSWLSSSPLRLPLVLLASLLVCLLVVRVDGQTYAVGPITTGLSATATSPTSPQPRSNPECAFDTTSLQPVMYALGGSADGGADGLSDLWLSSDGFTTAANAQYLSNPSNPIPRMDGGAAKLANGNLVWFAGLTTVDPASTYFVTSYYSTNSGASWNVSNGDNLDPLGRTQFAYCAVPYTNTAMIVGGIQFNTGAASNDVWMSSDGIAQNWTLVSAGNNTIVPFYGGAMVGLYDSSLASSAFSTPNSTLVLVAGNQVYQSFNLGATWSSPVTAGWAVATIGPLRNLASLAADHDNYLYFAGGTNLSPDVWFSVDKGMTWTQVGTTSALASGTNYAAAVGSCMAVTQTGSSKTLVLYSGKIYSYASATGVFSQPYYSLQIPLSYQSTVPTYLANPVPVSGVQVVYWKYTLGGAQGGVGYGVCASGTMTTGNLYILGTSPPGYQVYAINGTRTIVTSQTAAITQTIIGLGPTGDDGATNVLYASNPGVDGGGLTYLLNGVIAVVGQSTGNQTYVNLFNNSNVLAEDAWPTVPTGEGLALTFSTINNGQFSCPTPVFASGPITTGLSATATSPTSPQPRSNPECAFDTTSLQPVMYALGGSADGGADGLSDLWLSSDGFTTAANAQYLSNPSNPIPRMDGGAAKLANGNLVWFAGLTTVDPASTYFVTSYYSTNSGASWNVSNGDNLDPLGRTQFAYCAVPYTNTAMIVGGIQFNTGAASNDVWMSSDGIAQNWTLVSAGNNTIVPFYGGAMVGLYDSSLASSAFSTPNSTLVLVAGNQVYQSFNLGATWTRPGTAAWPVSSIGQPRNLASLAADHDNFLYYAGGTNLSPDVWFSFDKGLTWLQLGTTSALASGTNYAAAVGSCMAVTQTGSSKTLVLYSGKIYSYASATGVFSQPYYSLQIPLSYQSTVPTYLANPVPVSGVQVVYWKYTLGGAQGGVGYGVCASGTMTTGNLYILGTSPPGYQVYAINGTRTIVTSQTAAITQTIIGLGPTGDDGATNVLYASNPGVDGGGLTYLLNGVIAVVGQSTGNQTYVNLFNNSNVLAEDAWPTVPTGEGLALTFSTINNGQFSCPTPVFASGPITTGLSATATSPTSPQPRSNPECAFDTTSLQPVMYALGGSADGGADGLSDLWLSSDGFTTAANAQYLSNPSNPIPRMDGGAAKLANGNLVWFAGLTTVDPASTYFVTSYYSTNSGASWNVSNGDNLDPLGRTQFAYCAVPYTNTAMIVGGIQFNTGAASNDVWMSSDGIAQNWTLVSAGNNTIVPFYGGAMVGLYDSSLASSAFSTPNSTLVLVAGNQVYQSFNLGATWTRPGTAAWPVSSIGQPRNLASLAADHDNFLYYAGGTNLSPDVWFSFDKGLTWLQLGTTSALASGTNYAAAVGSCMAVTQTGSSKTLVLYSGKIYSYASATGVFSQPYYSLQIPLSYQSTVPTYLANPVPVSGVQVVYWKYTLGGAQGGVGYGVCASGTMTTGNLYILGTSPPGYQVYAINGTRTIVTSQTAAITQTIIGLGPTGDDGATNVLYASNPGVDGGGLTYLLNGVIAVVGQSTGNQTYVNLFNNSNVLAEDAWPTVPTGEGLALTFSTINNGQFSCPTPVFASGPITTGLSATATSPTSPQPRSNPECAFDTTSLQPVMYALGGSADGGADGLSDLWLSSDGFTTAANAQYLSNPSNPIPRMDGGAAKLANGNLVWFAGLTTVDPASTYFVTSYYSTNSGASWNVSNGDNLDPLGRTQFAYCAVPYTNTAMIVGGIQFNTGAASNDVWMSSDGIAQNWTLVSAGNNTIVPFYGGAMVGLYDSSLASSAFSTPNSTLVLVAGNQVYQSFNLGATWTRPGTAAWPVSSIGQPRNLASLAADHDNFLYYAGGTNLSPDVWFSFDKGLTWLQLGTTSALASGTNYAAAVGSCMAVTQTGSSKTLVLYSGKIYSYASATGVFSQPYYSLQIPLSYQSTVPTYLANPVPVSGVQVVYWKYTLGGAQGGVGYGVCASGTMTTGNLYILGTSPPGYQVYAINGTRTIVTSQTAAITQTIIGLGPTGDDGATNVLYASNPGVDGGGLTYLLNGVIAVVGQSTGNQTYVNLFNNSNVLAEDAWPTVPTGEGLALTFSTINNGQFSCPTPVFASGPITTGLSATATSPTSPQPRSNPECAFDTTSLQPVMYALGGSADGGADGLSDLWLSSDGFTTAANAQYLSNPSNPIPRMDGGAAKLANGNLVWFAGLTTVDPASTYFVTSYYSTNSGASWNVSNGDNLDPLGRTQFAYCAVPYTNTAMIVGGIQFNTGAASNDVWMSSDGIAQNWTLVSAGNNTIVPFYGGAMVGLYDSSLASSAFSTPNSTLVLVAGNQVYQSFNLGATWTRPGTAAWPVSSIGQPRNLASLAADHDNFLYYAGGTNLSPDVWFSFDKGLTWLQLGTTSALASGTNYAAAVGSCMAVTQTGSSKTLVLYSGKIYSYASATGVFSQPYYSLQIPLSYQSTVPTYLANPVPVSGVQVVYWKYTLGGAQGGVGYGVCASGTMTTGNLYILGTSPPGYQVYAINGTRTIVTSQTAAITQTIIGLGPTGDDGATNVLYASNPGVDGGGLTYLLNGVIAVVGQSTGNQTYVNMFNNSGVLGEDAWPTVPSPYGGGLTFGTTNSASYVCSGVPVIPVIPVISSSSGAGSVSSAPSSPLSSSAASPAASSGAPVVVVGPSSSSSGAAGGGGGGSGLSNGAIAGIVIGSVVGALLCLLLLLFCVCARARGKNDDAAKPREPGETSTVQPSHVEMVQHTESEESVAGTGRTMDEEA